jgi:hypothetical protein
MGPNELSQSAPAHRAGSLHLIVIRPLFLCKRVLNPHNFVCGEVKVQTAQFILRKIPGTNYDRVVRHRFCV